jgi:enoyl-CoA hydratase
VEFKDYQTLRFDYAGRVLTVTLDSGKPMNGVDERVHDELARVFIDLARDPDSDLIILTGVGRAFSAGGDAQWFQRMIEEPHHFRHMAPDAKRIIMSLIDLEKPVICRLNGAAAGLGATVALLCDIVIADETAKIGDPHVKVGLVAGDGGAVIWPQLIGFSKAKELLLTGDMLSATEAQALGLINYAVPTDQLDAKVAEIAGKILANPRWAVRWTKAAMNIQLRDIANKTNDAAMGYEILSNLTQDRKEAVQAFMEKRKPNLTGE